VITRTSKTCPKCTKQLPIESFSVNRTLPDGHSGWCSRCQAYATRVWRAANPAYVAAYNTARRSTYVRRSQQARTIAALATH
jgi:hypothetical protein